LALARFVVAEVGTVGVVRMAVVVVAGDMVAGDMVAGCTAEAAEVAVDMVRKVS